MTAPAFAETPEPPYYAVIFTSRRTTVDADYDATSRRMVELARGRDGFLGVESARGTDGVGLTVSYWRDLEAIRDWKADAEHRLAQGRGRQEWYAGYAVRITRVERAYTFSEPKLTGVA